MRRRGGRRGVRWLVLVVICGAALALTHHAGYMLRSPTDAAVTEVADGHQAGQPTTWDEASAPDYWRQVGSALVGTEPLPGTVEVLPLDELGRASGASATVTLASMEAGIARERQDMLDLRPSGWGHNAEVDIWLSTGEVNHGYFWNRSHLVAKSLGGPDTYENLICATRTQNVGANDGKGGMAYPEGLCRSWLAQHPDGSVYYRATPVYVGAEPICRSVFVDIRSSDGTLDMRLEVYNAARGFEIDYATGSFVATGTSSESACAAATTAVGTGMKDDELVIVSDSGQVYHKDRSCLGLTNANREKLREVTMGEATADGRHPCKICCT